MAAAAVAAVDMVAAAVAAMPADSAGVATVALQAATQAVLEEAPVDSRGVACTTLLTLDTRQDFAAATLAAASRPPMRTVM